MAAGWHAPVTGAMTSRLGRRFVVMFSLCALLPLIVFAAFSVSRVSTQMRLDTRKSLHNAAKDSGMAIASRLSQVAGDLALAAELAQSQRVAGAWSDGTALQRQLGLRCAAAWLFDGDNVQALCGESSAPKLIFDAAQLAHLAAGKPVVQLIGDPVELVMTLDFGDDLRVTAMVRREWFWDPDVLRRDNYDFAVCDLSGTVLFHTFTKLPATHQLATGNRQKSSRSIDWTVDGEPHLARYWHVFLQPEYALDLFVVQSRSQQDAFAVENSFVRWFWLIAICTLLCVVLASLIQMRRTLDPIISLRDATQRLGRGERDVRVWIESRDEFGDLGAAFNEMAHRLQQNIEHRERTEHELVASRDAALAAAKAKAEFVTNVSHEFRTPMAEILGAAEILTQLDDNDSSTRQEFSGIALHGAERLASLLDDVLKLGHATAGTMVSIDIAMSLEAAIAGMPEPVQKRVRLDLEKHMPSVSGNGQQLTETWCRLLDNAAKFSADDAAIELRASCQDKQIVVEVVDHGVGISRADEAHIFEAFSQVGRDQMIDKAHGTGLGLTLAKSAVESHGGSIKVNSTVGVGSTFRVCLPVEVLAPTAD